MAALARPVATMSIQVPGGPLALGPHDVHGLPVAQPRPERGADPVHLRADAAVADPRVNRVCKVQGRRAPRQLHDIAPRREAEHLVGVHLHLDVFQELVVVLRRVEPFREAGNPLGRIDRERVLRPHAVAVRPVGRHAGLGNLVHRLGPDLDLDPLGVAPGDGRVKRTVPVRLRLADVVLEPARHRAPPPVHRAQRGVAVRIGADDQPEPVDVGKPGEPHLLLLHLAPDGVRLLCAPEHPGLDPGFLELLLHVGRDPADHVPGLFLKRYEAPHDRVARLGIQDPEREVLEFVAHRLHAHPARERRVDVHGLARLLLLLFRRHGPDGAHVVEPVGELDENHAQVLRHRDEQLAEVLRLLRLRRRELEVRELRDAVDQSGDLGAELALHLFTGGSRILDRVVEQRRDDGGVIQPLLGQDRRDRDRMREVRLARSPALALVHALAVRIGPADQVSVGLRIVVLDQRDQVVGGEHPVPPRSAPTLKAAPGRLPSAPAAAFPR